MANTSAVAQQIRSVDGVLALLDVAVLDTLAQENSPLRTRALVSLAQAFFKAFEVGEFEQRLEAIEQALKLTPPSLLQRVGGNGRAAVPVPE